MPEESCPSISQISKNVSTTEVPMKYIEGLVIGRKSMAFYVTCNRTYPGVDGIVYSSVNRQLNIGDWIEIQLSESEFSKYFPVSPTEKTPRFTFTYFTKIKKPKNYSMKMTGRGPEVNIKRFQLPVEHRKGNDINDRFLGNISDDRSLIVETFEFVDLVIRRRAIFKTKNKNFATWFVSSAKKSVERSESSDSRTSSSSENQELHAEGGIKSETNPNKNQSRSNRSVVAKAMKKNTDPSVAPPTETDTVNLEESRALVTYVKKNNNYQHRGNSIAYLWLIDAHVHGVYYFSLAKYPNIEPGHFLTGTFRKEQKKWICIKYEPLEAIFDCFIYKQSVEIPLTVYKYSAQSQERLNPETHHEFLGKIIDKYNKLPQDCSAGVHIRVKMMLLHERGEHCWVVSRFFHSSKYIQMISEFHDAWHTPGIQDIIRLKCPREFSIVRTFLDTGPEGNISQLQNYGGTRNVRKYVWVTGFDEDNVQMVVFPRGSDQKMSDMKKNVSNKYLYEKVKQMGTQRFYSIKWNEKGNIVEVSDCPDFCSNSEGEIEFNVVWNDDHLLARNVAIVGPIGVPEQIGKLIFCPQKPISEKKVLLKATFRLLDDDDLFVDDEVVRRAGVCFLSIGSIEISPNQDLQSVERIKNVDETQKILRNMKSLIKIKLEGQSREVIFGQFQSICKILNNQYVIEDMKKKNIDTKRLTELRETYIGSQKNV